MEPVSHRFVSSFLWTNNLERCVSIGLTCTPTGKSGQFELHLTINFGAERMRVRGGYIYVGIRSGELRFSLTNARMPFKERRFRHDLSATYSATRVMKNGQSCDTSTEKRSQAGIKVGLDPARITSGSSFESSTSAGTKFTASQETTVTVQLHQIRAQGPDEQPSWMFETLNGAISLTGGRIEELLGLLVTTGECPSISAEFVSSRCDLLILRSDGIWPENTPLNKVGVVKRLILRELMKKTEPFISRMAPSEIVNE